MKHIVTLLTILTFSFISNFAQTNYQLVWTEDFDGTSLNTANWNYEQGGHGWGNSELQCYTNRTENVRVKNGCLIIEAIKEPYPSASPTNQYTSGRITTQNKVKTTYGKVEALISLPPGQGTWPAFWMMPNDNAYGNWPRSGEIDIMEHVGYDPTMISFATHTYYRNGTKGNNLSSKIYSNNVENNFHLYGIEWLDDRIIFYFDGVAKATFFRNFSEDWRGWPFDKDFFIILNVAVGGKMGGTVDDNIFNSAIQMKVDYVKIYQPVTTPIESHQANTPQIGPNPFDAQININNSEPAHIQMYDSYGRLVKTTTLGAGEPLPTHDLSQGLYMLNVTINGIQTTHKVIKE